MPRKRMFDRLPMAWKRLDLMYGPDGKPVPGVLERFLEALDTGFNRSHDKAKELLTSRSVDNIQDRFLALLTALVGQQWRSGKSHDWHRRKTASAIPRWSCRGADTCLGDLIAEHGGTEWTVVDMASKTIVLGRQGTFGAGNMYFQAADFYHRGAFVLTVDDGIDIESFKEDFEEFRPSGTRWWIYVATRIQISCERLAVWQIPNGVSMTNALEFSIGYGKLGQGLCFNGAPSNRAWEMHRPVTMAVFGGFGAAIDLMDPMFVLSDENVQLNSGTPQNPVSDEVAGRRAAWEIH